MKVRADVRTLELMARAARVREILSRHVLARAIEEKGAQQDCFRQAEACADCSGAALEDTLRGPTIDLARLPLLQELAAHVDAALAMEHRRLTQCEQRVMDQADAAGKRTRHRERLEEKAAAASDFIRQTHEACQLELATEAWLTRRHAGVQ